MYGQTKITCMRDGSRVDYTSGIQIFNGKFCIRKLKITRYCNI